MKPSYTRAEKREQAWLLLRGSRQAVADAVDPRIEARLDAIGERGRERALREAAALLWRLEAAKDAAADARAAERTAPRAERSQARRAVKETQKRVERVQQEVDRYRR
ncbi:hypothetical protein ACWCZ5_16330 [Streptomyces sp. NPDC001667]